ncbi:MAG: hypothetical protein U9N59_07090 [Campylobacterota bacterium]|nr:hypothetical protein [Campylobacterota bacterium]
MNADKKIPIQITQARETKEAIELLERILHQFEVNLEAGVDYNTNKHLKKYCRISTKVWKDMIIRIS